EVAMLEVYSVDASRHIVTIVQGKGKKDRVIPIGRRALGWIAHYVREVRPQLLVNPHCPALFVALDGVEGLTPNGITNLVSHYIRASGIAKWGSCHLFRHAMATQMLENGADLRWIQAMLGHASVESTQIYTQVSIRALQAVHA
ncbi:tyrosine-type recombinase/integrase, partial [Dickeya chrysanthemi]